MTQTTAVIDRYLAPPVAAAQTAAPVDARMVGIMRLVLATSALAVTCIDPAEPARFATLTYASLAAYILWSLYLLFDPRLHVRYEAWTDVAWATYLVALTQGTSSIFFFLFLFAILVASFSGGYRSGLGVSIASSVLFCAVGWAFAPPGDEFELNRTLIRPIYLLVLGWMMAYWGGRELVLRQRLSLLRDISATWNPRLGVQRTALQIMEQLMPLFRARECVLLTRSAHDGHPTCTLYRVVSKPGVFNRVAQELDATLGERLIDLPERRTASYSADGPLSRSGASVLDGRLAEISNLLDSRVFATVPYQQGDGTVGRLFVMRDTEVVSESDLAFLEQLAAAMSHVVENTQLIDELVLKAAEHERFRISLDIHDSTVQPYIGLKLGLDALYREADGNTLRPRVADLLEMANSTIADLRGFATGIRQRAPLSGESLINAVREQAERFNRFYRVEVRVECEEPLFISPHVASEAFRLISEGLSNIMRHTVARQAKVAISRSERFIRVMIMNEAWGQKGTHRPFTPRSMKERVQSLSGDLEIEQADDGRTSVYINIPI